MDQKFLESAMESLYDGIFIVGTDGLILYANRAYELFAGRTREDYVGHYMDELVESGLMRTSVFREVIKTREPVTAEEDFPSGRRVVITANPIFDEDGEVIGVATNLRDVTQLIKLEREANVNKELLRLYQQEILADSSIDHIICASKEMKHVLSVAGKVARKDSTVLITGDTGVGKEVVAKYIHSKSKRHNEKYIKVNCGAIPRNLLESEFFGYVKGAFTGASDKGKLGLFELANKGTLFLDEIGEIPLDMQVSLLRVLQEREVTRVGDEKSRLVNVRIIAATNRDLGKMVEEGTFRRDLYYRLNVVPLTVPGLDERKEDISPLAELFVRKLNEKYDEHKVISPRFLKNLIEREWPGNIRELQNFIEQQYVMQDEVLDDIWEREQVHQETRGEDEPLTLADAVARVERDLIRKAMERATTTSEGAKLLGLSQATFWRKYNKYKEAGEL